MKPQTTQLYELLSDGKAHRTDEIVSKIYSGGALARVGGRINDLANGNWSGKFKCEFVDQWGNPLGVKKGEFKGWRDPQNGKLYWYRMKNPLEVVARINATPAFKPAPVAPPEQAHGSLFS